MNKLIKSVIWVGMAVLIVANITIFVHGVKLSDEIHGYEAQLSQIRQENTELEKQVFKFDSVVYAASLAAELDYTATDTNSIYLGQPGFAYNH